MKAPRCAGAALGALLLAACEPTQLYTGARTVIGINAAVNLEQTSGSLVIGYDRSFAAVVPRSVEAPGQDGRDAMSALVCSDLQVQGITIRHYSESLATGQAATDFADQLRNQDRAGQARVALRDFFRCLREAPATAGSGS
ncbi:hypothetical protein GXW76_12665 [Roseomonas soli]|uniref:Uncharacterized protein n=1 Tax=Neoroseomonas soli TaxID=1081025 RepID=A0A9X9WXZ7_9PROT|nr:hypothetical protein [Neoroseomonas soli]